MLKKQNRYIKPKVTVKKIKFNLFFSELPFLDNYLLAACCIPGCSCTQSCTGTSCPGDCYC